MSDPAALRVFISYRREDSAGQAGRLCDSLSSRLPTATIFMDVGAIELGVDFATAIADAIASCDVMLALIGKRWITAATDDGSRRLDDPDDYVAMEIAAALERDTRVIPVLLEGAEMPRAVDLPARLQGLERRNALTLDTVSWSRDIEALISPLHKLLPESPRQATGASHRSGRATVPGESAESRPSSPGGRTVWDRRRLRWIVAAVAAASVVATFLLIRSGRQRNDSDILQSVVVSPASGPAGTSIEIAGGACPPIPEGKRPHSIYFGLDPRVEAADIPVAGEVPLVPGKPWKAELVIPSGVSTGQYIAYAGCSAKDDASVGGSSFHDFLPATFEVTEG